MYRDGPDSTGKHPKRGSSDLVLAGAAARPVLPVGRASGRRHVNGPSLSQASEPAGP